MLIREEIVKLLGNKCVICSSKQNLEIHHKDKNYRNNNLNNLMLLCRHCHKSLVHVGELKEGMEWGEGAFKLSPKGNTGLIYVPAHMTVDSAFPLKPSKVDIEVMNGKIEVRPELKKQKEE